MLRLRIRERMKKRLGIARGLLALAILIQGGGRAGAWRPARGDPSGLGVSTVVESNAGRAWTITDRAPGSRLLVVVATGPGLDRPIALRLKATPADPTGIVGGRSVLAEESGHELHKVDRPSMPMPAIAADRAATLPATARIFSVLAREGDPASARNYEPVQGVLRAVGRSVAVYVDRLDLDKVAPETLREAVSTFDETVEPRAVRRFGSARDVDRDGRFTILFTARSPRGRGVDGFVRAADFDPDLAPPFGNRCDLMCLNPNLKAGPYLRTILAHEYAHAILISRKADALGRVDGGEEDWLDEAIAHCVEADHGFSAANLDYRVDAFLAAPERYGLVVADYYRSGLFRSHGHRGAGYLFLSWCLDRHEPGLLETLVGSPESGVANLEAATGRRFAELFRSWALDLFLDGLAGSHAIPSAHRIEPGGPADVWTMAGTSLHYAIVEGSSDGAVGLEVAGPPDADFSLIVQPMPTGSDLPILSARLETSPESATRLGFTIEAPVGGPFEVESIAWSPLVPAARPTPADPTRGTLAGDELRQALGTVQLRPGDRLASRPGAGPLAPPGRGPIAVRLRVRDDRGRPLTVWSEAVVRPKTLNSPETDPDNR